MASPGLTEIVTTTLRYRSGKLADNVTNNNAVLKKLKEMGQIKIQGGRTIVQELDFSENTNFTFFSGYEVLPTAPQEVLTAAEYDWKQAAVGVTISGEEMRKNSGKEAVLPLLESRIKNAERTLMNKISTSLYSNGTGYGGKEIGGLQLLVADSPATGVVGAIDGATYTKWRNTSFDATTDGGAAVTSANIQGYMNRVMFSVMRGTDSPDIIIADTNYYNGYLGSLQTIQRLTDEDSGGAGFAKLKYYASGKAVDVVLDGGIGGGCPTNHMYFLNTNYLNFVVHKDLNFATLGKARESIDQDAMVQYMGVMCNLVTSGRQFQAVLKD